jgi:hypothetical protein
MYERRVLGFLMLAVKNSKKRLLARWPSLAMMAGRMIPFSALTSSAVIFGSLGCPLNEFSEAA